MKAGRRNLLNFSSYFISKALSLGLFAFAVSYFVRHEGEHAYGVVSLILMLYSYLQMVDMGMGYAVAYRLGRVVARGGGGKRIVAEALPIYLACSVLIGAILVFLSEPISIWLLGSAVYSRLFELAGLGSSMLILSSLCVAVMQAYNRVYFVNLSRLLFDGIKAAALIASVGLGDGLGVVLWITMLGALIKLLLDVFLVSHLLGTNAWLKPVISRRGLLLNINFGAPMFVSSLSFSVINSLDKIVVAKLFSPAVLAVYSVATDLHAKAYFLIWAVTGSLYTILIHRHARGESVRNLIRLAVFAVIGTLLIYYIPLAVFAHNILELWINVDFADKGYNLLRWLLLPTILYMAVNIMEVYLQTAGAAKKFGWIYVFALAVQIIGLATLPQKFGLIGVVWAVSLMYSSLALCFLSLVIDRRKRVLEA